jgi:acetate---CoA ligase (ADP-forming)
MEASILENNPLQLMLNPRSIATVGAGNNPLKMGAIQALSIVKDGYPGKFYPLHPTEKEVFGYRAYRTAYDLPEPPDLVMFVLPAPLVVKIMEDFGKIGTKRAIVITAGFRETGSEGELLEEQLKEVAARYGIRFLGPNCMGIINSALPLNVTVCPLSGEPGLLGIASQSGTYITQTLPYLQDKGIRLAKAISVGNEGDLDLTDALAYLGADQQSRAVALYIEGLKDAGRFLEVARRVTAVKPVVAQYVGGSDAGARAGSSHTGALAGPDYLYDGLFKQAGIIRVSTVEELYYHGWMLASQPPLKGKRIGVLTNSGGPGTAISHTCNAGGLDVPPFSEKLQQEIRKHLPAHGAVGNPVDLTFHMDAEVISVTLPDLLLKSKEIDGLVIHGLMGTGFLKAIYPHVAELFGGMDAGEFVSQFERDLTEALSIPDRYGLPVVVSSFFGREDNFTSAYRDRGIPVFDGPEKAAKAMLALYRYNLVDQRAAHQPAVLPAVSARAREIIDAAVQSGRRILDEYESKQILSAYGVPVSPEILAHSVNEAIAAAIKIGYPLVLKGCSTEFAHKTGQGLVHLNLQDETQLLAAYRIISQAAGQEIPVLVSKMVKGERELMAGLVRHPAFGPVVLFGLGGVLAEALQDRTFRLAPLSETDTLEMIVDLKAAEVIGSYRGLPAVDRKALSSILQAVGNLGLLHPEIEEVDLNPVMISGAAPVVVDALMILNEAASSSTASD